MNRLARPRTSSCTARPAWRGLLLLALALPLAACGGGGSTGASAGPGPVALSIVEPVASVRGGASPTSQQLTLVATLAGGGTVTLVPGYWPFSGGGTVVWSSDNPAVASVAGGNVTGVAIGRTTIRATVGALQASVPAAVSVPPVATAARVPVSDVGTGLSLPGGSSSGNHASRCIAIDTLGRVHVTWFDPATGLRYARSVDGGVSFQASLALVNLMSAPAPQPIITCSQAAQDDVYIVYTDSTNAVRCLRSPDAGTTWLTPGALTGIAGGGQTSAAVRGATVMVFSTNGSTMARSTDGGTTFGTPTPGLLSGNAFNDVLMDPRNLKVVAISDDPNLYFRVSTDDGLTFGSQVSQTASLFFSDYAIDQLGNVFCVSQPAAWMRVNVDTQVATTVASALAGAGNPGRAVAVDSLNVVHIVRDSGGNVLLQTSADQGATISAEATLDTGASVPSCAATFAFPGVGVVYLRGGSVFYMHN